MADKSHPIVRIAHFGSFFDGKEGVLVEIDESREMSHAVQFPNDFSVYWFDRNDVIGIGNVTDQKPI